MWKQNENNGVSPSLLIFSSALIWTGAVALGIASPVVALISLAGLSLGIGELSHKMLANKIERFCRNLKIQINEEYPRVTDTEENKDSAKYTLYLPCGLSVKSFERHQQELEAYLDGSVTFAADGNRLIIDVCRVKLNETYDYTPVACSGPLEVCIGYSRRGQYNLDIEAAPHILIAGATGAGKSVLLRSIITSLITQKRGIELNLVDFQRVELSIFTKCSAVKDFCSSPEQFAMLLSRMRQESDARLTAFDRADCVNISEYNARHKEKLPYIVNIVDEFASLSEPEYKSILQELKIRVAQDRKCGVHYIVCSQRPSVDIISGSIKANIPLRICLKTSSETDSRVVLDSTGAELLRGRGHALVRTDGLEEVQCMYLTDAQAKARCCPFMVNKPEPANISRSGGVSSVNRSRSKNHKVP